MLRCPGLEPPMLAIRIGPAALVLAAGLAPGAVAAAGSDPFGARVTLTSDYVFRGVSQSRQRLAVQGGFDFIHDSGFFAGIWASSVDFPFDDGSEKPRRLELDIYLGLERELAGDWSGSFTLTRYDYPGSDLGRDLTYEEVLIGLEYGGQIAAHVAYTDGYLGTDKPSFTYELAAGYPAPFRLTLKGSIGYSDLRDLVGEGYTFWSVGLSRTVSGLTFDLGYFGTDSAGRRIWPEQAGNRVAFSVTATTR